MPFIPGGGSGGESRRGRHGKLTQVFLPGFGQLGALFGGAGGRKGTSAAARLQATDRLYRKVINPVTGKAKKKYYGKIVSKNTIVRKDRAAFRRI